MNVLLIQVDGKLPNLALMKLAHWHRSQDHTVTFTRYRRRDIFDPPYDRVYASAIFHQSQKFFPQIQSDWPQAIIGGTGSNSLQTVEELIGQTSYERYDYSDYPNYQNSIGFTKRGCRLSCKFCVVPQKEGKPYFLNSIYDIWRGAPYPRKLHLLDNDFFGHSSWKQHIQEIIDGDFRVCFSQGINIRMITDETAAALASIQYRDTKFKKRIAYTAYDNLRDTDVFFAGINKLEKAGIPPSRVRAYMLIGYDRQETWDRIWYRFRLMVERKIQPYPMVYTPKGTSAPADLKCFQRWVNVGLYRFVSWPDYRRQTKSDESVAAWHRVCPHAGANRQSP
jgi:hypothetical protein